MTQKAYVGIRVDQRTLDKAKSLFGSDEKLFCVVHVALERGAKSSGFPSTPRALGLLLITNKRLMFYHPQIFGRYEQLVFPYDKISAVYCHKGLLADSLQFTVASDMMTITVARGDGDIAAKYIRVILNTMKAQPSLAITTPQTDIADQIEKIDKLRKKGLITDEEFERKKNELLKRL